MAIDIVSASINSSSTVCRSCGKAYQKLKTSFPISYAPLHKGVGFLPYCKDCVDKLFDDYYDECRVHKDAMRQVCRKIDVYWSEKIYEEVEKTSAPKTIPAKYLMRIASLRHAGKSYDDTLREEGMLWTWGNDSQPARIEEPKLTEAEDTKPKYSVPEEVRRFWGAGNDDQSYIELEERYQYWKDNLPDNVDISDVGVQALLRQICSLEVEANRERAAGKSTEKLANTINSLLGSTMLKPAQKKEESLDASIEKTPFGVWLFKYENKRPLPELDEEFKDINGIRKYVSTWVRGHLAKMVGIKNSYSQMYEDAINQFRVERPEYDEEDDEDLMYDIFNEGEQDESL